MKTIFTELGRSLMAVIVFGIICCVIYPLIIFGIGRTLFPHQTYGSLLIDKSGTVRGSELLCQNFTSDKYFHPRPSAAGNNGYDPTASGGSNLGPTSSTLYTNIMQNVAAYRSDNNVPAGKSVPADAVTESGSGLDPHISVANAGWQIPRVAKQRGMTEDQVRKLVEQNTSEPDLGIFGEPRVNVMTLNFALDQLSQK
jgi:K+-transporting ATPase ATPase C chain